MWRCQPAAYSSVTDPLRSKAIQKLGYRFNARHQQLIPRPRAGYIQQVPLRVVHLLQVAIVAHGFHALLQWDGSRRQHRGAEPMARSGSGRIEVAQPAIEGAPSPKRGLPWLRARMQHARAHGAASQRPRHIVRGV